MAPYLNPHEAAKHLKCSEGYLSKGRVTGEGPRYLKLGKAIRYRIEDLDAWASARMHGSTAEYSSRALPELGSRDPPLSKPRKRKAR